MKEINNQIYKIESPGFDIFPIILTWMRRHFSNQFCYGGAIPNSELNQFFSCRFSLKKEETRVCLRSLSSHYPFLVRYKRGLKVKL